MKVKKYVAPTMPEVMQQIRAELGPDAVILNSKEIKQGGFLGFFKQKKIEVVAALDPKPIMKSDKTVVEPLQKTVGRSQEKDQQDIVLKEIKYLRKVLEQQSKNQSDNYAPDYQVAFNYLQEQEVNKDIATEIIEAIILKHQRKNTLITKEEIINDLKYEINLKLADTPFNGITYEQKVIHFVGPTGVGKTTTLAKIAAESILIDKKKVAFITSDTYRIAAIEQLKTYARILDIPIDVAYSEEDYEQAINKYSHYDLILVDTAGRNFRDEKYVKALLNHSGYDVKFYLVLSLTAKPKDISDIYNQFEHLKIKEVIFTKLDETSQYGSILNIAQTHKVGVAYITNGQDVPEDLVKPSADLITNYIMSAYDNE